MGDIYNYEEEWSEIEGFPRYLVSSEGRIYNKNTNRYMKYSSNNFGHLKISLLTEDGRRYTRSVPFLVARAFIEPPNDLCDRIIHLNGDATDARADNLAWRPRWFCWKYTRQFKIEQPSHYKNVPVVNLETNVEYESVIEAAQAEGLLFDQIWHSTYAGNPVFPDGSVWQTEYRV